MFTMCPGFVLPNAPIRLGILGGSFNPAHKAHVDISKRASDIFNLDCILWLICDSNPLKSCHYISLTARVIRVRDLTENHKIGGKNLLVAISGCRVMEAIDALRRSKPMYELLWIMGDDSWMDLAQWFRWPAFRNTLPIVVFRRNHSIATIGRKPHARSGFCGVNTVKMKGGCWAAMSNTVSSCSSTVIRALTDVY